MEENANDDASIVRLDTCIIPPNYYYATLANSALQAETRLLPAFAL